MRTGLAPISTALLCTGLAVSLAEASFWVVLGICLLALLNEILLLIVGPPSS